MKEGKTGGNILTKEVEELMKTGEEELFALLGLQAYIRFDSGVKKEDYRKIDPNFYKDKTKAEKILGQSISDKQWNELVYMNRRETATHRMLEKGEITDEDLYPTRGKFDENYQPSLELMRQYVKISSGWGK